MHVAIDTHIMLKNMERLSVIEYTDYWERPSGCHAMGQLFYDIWHTSWASMQPWMHVLCIPLCVPSALPQLPRHLLVLWPHLVMKEHRVNSEPSLSFSLSNTDVASCRLLHFHSLNQLKSFCTFTFQNNYSICIFTARTNYIWHFTARTN